MPFCCQANIDFDSVWYGVHASAGIANEDAGKEEKHGRSERGGGGGKAPSFPPSSPPPDYRKPKDVLKHLGVLWSDMITFENYHHPPPPPPLNWLLEIMAAQGF